MSRFGSGSNGNITLSDPFFEKATPEWQRVATLLEENFHTIQNITVFSPGTADLAETEVKELVDEALRRIYRR